LDGRRAAHDWRTNASAATWFVERSTNSLIQNKVFLPRNMRAGFGFIWPERNDAGYRLGSNA
ncbi:MAG: hypothetical protein WA718_13715, partial [Terriglobales bacterium]